MEISDFARRLLQAHATHPNQLFYAIDLLGSFYRDSDLRRLDAAYDELHAGSLIAKSGAVVSFFGEPKALYRITQAGIEEAAREKVA